MSRALVEAGGGVLEARSGALRLAGGLLGVRKAVLNEANTFSSRPTGLVAWMDALFA